MTTMRVSPSVLVALAELERLAKELADGGTDPLAEPCCARAAALVAVKLRRVLDGLREELQAEQAERAAREAAREAVSTVVVLMGDARGDLCFGCGDRACEECLLRLV